MSAVQIIQGKGVQVGGEAVDGLYTLMLAGEKVLSFTESGEVFIKGEVKIQYKNDQVEYGQDLLIGGGKWKPSSTPSS